MADNIDDKHLNNPANTQSENSSDEIIPAKPIQDPEPIKPNQETKNMEVHKHPRHVTRPKNWKEYFLEFFMIFLAVFLGFVAENIREHAVEKDRAKQYAKSLISDLEKDTIMVDWRIEQIARSIAKMTHYPPMFMTKILNK